MTDTPLSLDTAALERLQELCSQPAHDLLAAISAEFGEDDAPMLYNLAVMLIAGWVLKTGPGAEHAADAINQLWGVLDVPFSTCPGRSIDPLIVAAGFQDGASEHAITVLRGGARS